MIDRDIKPDNVLVSCLGVVTLKTLAVLDCGAVPPCRGLTVKTRCGMAQVVLVREPAREHLQPEDADYSWMALSGMSCV